jgi:hypothetical protein
MKGEHRAQKKPEPKNVIFFYPSALITMLVVVFAIIAFGVLLVHYLFFGSTDDRLWLINELNGTAST